jgi:hypothetical protein
VTDQPDWIACQLGAREHYAVPRMLHARGQLRALITDAWVPPGSPLAGLRGPLAKRLSGRFHPDLADAEVHHASVPLLLRTASERLARSRGWAPIMSRNDWFQARARWILRARHLLRAREGAAAPIAFAYSYAARAILAEARAAGCATVLGQIDGGPVDAALIDALARTRPASQSRWVAPPPEYWGFWRTECLLADLIVVNSEWSRGQLIAGGIPEAKLRVVPLAYEPPADLPQRAARGPIDEAHPLEVLFLGAATMRKGLGEFVAAAEMMRGEAVRFTVVGAVEGEWPQDLPNLRWLGPTPRHQVSEHYAKADVFVMPTHSDGFGITQVEAMAHGLPVIASRHCGRVVTDTVDGLLLDTVSGEELARAVRRLAAAPCRLTEMAAAARSAAARYRLERVAGDWAMIGTEAAAVAGRARSG